MAYKRKNAVAYGSIWRKSGHVYLHAYRTPQDKKVKVYAGAAADYAATDSFHSKYMVGGGTLMEGV